MLHTSLNVNFTTSLHTWYIGGENSALLLRTMSVYQLSLRKAAAIAEEKKAAEDLVEQVL